MTKFSHLFLYIKFLLKSSNAHGIHSPFVYNLITLCLRKKYKKDIKFKKYVNGFPKFLNLKSIQILNDLILYLKTENYYCITEEKHSFLLLPSLEKLQKKHPENSDLIYVSENNQNIKLLLDLISNLKQNGLLIIENPYSNKVLWEEVKNKLDTQIVVDTFYYGLIFNRKQQAKENFKIRI